MRLGVDDLHFVSSLGILFSLSILVVTYVCLWWHHPLYGKNKGPVVYPIVGTFIGVLWNLEHIHDWMTEQLKKKTNSMTARFVRPGSAAFYLTASPKNVEYILKTNFDNYPKGPETCNNLSDLLGSSIFNVDGELWKEQRRVAMHEFTTKSLRNFMHEIVQVELDNRLIPVLSKASSEGVLVDLHDIFMRFTFDTICNLGFGVDPGCLDISLPNVKLAHAFDTATAITSSRFFMYPFVWGTMRALNIGSERILRESLRQINEFAMHVIQKRRQKLLESSTEPRNGLNSDDAPEPLSSPPHMDLLSRFMGVTTEAEKLTLDSSGGDDQKRGGYSDVFLRDIVISFLLAGRDSTSSGKKTFREAEGKKKPILKKTVRNLVLHFLVFTSCRNLSVTKNKNKLLRCFSSVWVVFSTGISWLFWLLSRHRRVVDAIRAEIREVVKSRNCTNLSTDASKFTYEELKNMHYLHAALSESLRLHPPLPVDTKFALKEDVLPDGTHIPKGSVVAFGPYAMGRMEQLWGSDCLEFKPERWLQNGVFVPQCPYKYAVFQAGPRICLGKELALQQIKLVTAGLINCFDFYVPEDFKPTYELSLLLPMKYGLPTKISPRERES
jgi:fatty acid omega-hydroxylase